MAFKKLKQVVSAVLTAALAVTASATYVQGENFPLASKSSEKLYSSTRTIAGEAGSVNNVVGGYSSSVMGMTGSFKGTSYYEQIDADSQKIYNAIFNEYKGGMKNGAEIELIEYFPEMNFKITGSVSGGYFTPDQKSLEMMDSTVSGYLFPAYLALAADHPELSWISYGMYSMSYGGEKITPNSDGTYSYPITSVQFSLTTDNIYGTPDEMTSAISKAKGVIGTQETMYEQAKAIHDYLCNTIDYNYTALTPPAGYDAGYYQTAYSAFYRIAQDAATELGMSTDKNLTVCAGYARSFKILCDEYNIPCIYVVGYGVNNSGDGEAHAWNYVKMDDGKWYAVDTTWDDQTQRIYYEYFLAGKNTPGFNDLTFGQSHVSSGVWSSDSSFVFEYPTLASEAYDPTKTPEETTAETTTEPEPADTTTEATTTEPEPADTTTEATTTEPEPADTTTEATTTEPEPADTSAETTTAEPEPADTSTETTTAEPEPADTSTAATTAEPEPADTSTEATTTEPEPADTSDATTNEPAPDVTTTESTSAPEEEGNADANINVGEGAPEAEIDMDEDQLIDAVLSDEEKELLMNGTVSIDFNIDSADKTVSDEIKKAVEDYLAEFQDGSYDLGLYLDISLFKTINGEKTAVAETNKPIRIVISVPENLQKDGRSFGLVRVHDGKTEFLSDLDTAPETITIESDKFSTYAVVYSDEPAKDPAQDDENKNTGFGFENSLVITMIISAAAVFGSAITIYFKSAKSKK